MSKKRNEDFTGGVDEVLKFYKDKKKEPESKAPETALDQVETEPFNEEKRFSGLDVSKKAYKTRRVQLLLRPETHDKLKELAERLREETGNQKISVNEIINQVLESFLKGVEIQ